MSYDTFKIKNKKKKRTTTELRKHFHRFGHDPETEKIIIKKKRRTPPTGRGPRTEIT